MNNSFAYSLSKTVRTSTVYHTCRPSSVFIFYDSENKKLNNEKILVDLIITKTKCREILKTNEKLKISKTKNFIIFH